MDIPQGVNVRMDGATMIVKGPQGEVKRAFPKGTTIKVNGSAVEVSASDYAIKGTTEAIIRNMIDGAAKGYTKNLKLIYAHFPISIEVKGSDVAIKNFLGEKQARKTILIGSTKVQAKGQLVTISGPDKEAVGQTLANIRNAMKIKDKDGRVFQDGIYDAEG
ncbi:50S ribosomal protein L6 [Candidatus Micrarchaeota archaeon]|nr:50S ribosomal protein L6 [Candidatus Micrarchaeota archaeon]